MIKVTVKFENKDKDAEDTVVQSNFKDFDKIYPWLEKIKALHDEDKVKQPAGFM